MQLILMLLIMAVVLVLCLLIYQIMTRKRRKRQKITEGRKRKALIKTTTYLKWYKTLSRNYITRRAVKRLHTQVAELSIFGNVEVRILCVRVYLLSNLVSYGVVILSAYLFRDLFIILIMMAYSVVIKEVTVNKQLDKLHYKLYLQLSDALSGLRQGYMQKESVTEALAELECGNLIARPMAEIHGILTSVNVADKLDDFYQSSPLKIIQTLAGICYAIQDQGDTRLANGLSNFIVSLSMISSEVNLEVRRLSLQRAKFGSLELLPILPIFAISPIKNFFINEIPGTAAIYNGLFGYIAVIVIIFISIISFKAITAVTRPIAIRYDDREYIDRKLLESRRVKRFVRSLRPVKPKHLQKKLVLLQKAMSRQNLDHLYLRKAYFAGGAFFITLLVLTMSVQISKEFLENSVMSFDIMGGKEFTEEERKGLKAIDDQFLKATEKPKDSEIEAQLRAVFPKSKARDIDDQIKRMYEKEKRINDLGFSYIMFWLALGGAIVSWFIPDIILRLRAWLILTESQEDCLQLQTIIGIMMNTSIDTLSLLDWLANHSRVYRPLLIDAYHSYPAYPVKALERLKNKANIAEMKHMIDKLLLTVSDISLADAFADIMSERDHLLRMREIAQNKTIETKRTAMSPVAVLTSGLVVGLLFVLPILILAITQFQEVLQNL